MYTPQHWQALVKDYRGEPLSDREQEHLDYFNPRTRASSSTVIERTLHGRCDYWHGVSRDGWCVIIEDIIARNDPHEKRNALRALVHRRGYAFQHQWPVTGKYPLLIRRYGGELARGNNEAIADLRNYLDNPDDDEVAVSVREVLREL